MKKLFLIFFIIFLTIFTTVTKNSTKKLESQIYSVKENISILKNKYGLVLLEYNYLTTPKKLIEYQSKYSKAKFYCYSCPRDGTPSRICI